MQHPLSQQRRTEVKRYRQLTKLLGPAWVGKGSCWLYRKNMLSPRSMAYYVLNTDPLVVYLGNVMERTFEIAELYKHRSVHFIKNFYQTFENEERLSALKREVDQFQHFYPQHTIHFICATPNEHAMFEAAGIPDAHFINKNAFVDENMFVYLPEVVKEFDALHNGQLAPYKRHELASNISSLALIVYLHSRSAQEPATLQYGTMIREKLAHATWLNDVGQFIAPAEISQQLCRAHVGLCLSAEEGPMAAMMEYFLSGLPVVSTRSLGGREVFFDDEYVRVVDDTPQAVAAGVRELVELQIPPERVRTKTLEKMQLHRSRFVELVNSILTKAGAAPNFESTWPKIFVNKMRTSAPFPGAFLTHSVQGMPIELCQQMAGTNNA